MRSRQAGWWTRCGLVVGALCLLLAACAGNPGLAPASQALAGGSCSLDQAGSDEEIIWATIAAESRTVVAQDIERLMALWAEDGSVIDAANTPNDSQDDQTWQGSDAVRYRYTRYVFPSAPAAAQPSDLAIKVEGDQAVVTATTGIGEEVSPGGDRWELQRVDGCWYLKRLVFNLEAPAGP